MQNPSDVTGYVKAVVLGGRPLPDALAGLGVEGADPAPVVVQDSVWLGADRHDHREPAREAGALAQVAHHGLRVEGVSKALAPDVGTACEVVGTQGGPAIRGTALAVRVHRVHHAVSHHRHSVREVICPQARVARPPELLTVPGPHSVHSANLVLEDEGPVAAVHGHRVPEAAIHLELPQEAAICDIEARHGKSATARHRPCLADQHPVNDDEAGEVRAKHVREPGGPELLTRLHAKGVGHTAIVRDVEPAVQDGGDAPRRHGHRPQELALTAELVDATVGGEVQVLLVIDQDS
mmetsp:Transcript_5065/g.14816  ORF Transcript_5065/g.14816 Transcript_5065/m.14816 type:complete len:294 (+) Transcript_5065:423-1304(+)